MRFSDMMGSGEGPPAVDEAETAEAEAASPNPGATQPEKPADVPAVAEVAPTPPTPPAPLVPLPPIPVAVGPIAEEPIAISFADFTPLSDDLLPRRR